MTVQPCTLPAEDLIAYADGYLGGGRRELVEAHLATCPHCQERMAAFDEVDRLLQQGTPLTDDPNGRAMVRTRLEMEINRSGRTPRLLAVPLLALVSLLVLAFVIQPVTEAGFPLGRFVTFGEFEVKQWLPEEERGPVEHVAPSDPSVSELPFRTVEPAVLPLGLMRVERSIPGPERLELLYRDGGDLAILVTQTPAEPDMVTIDGPRMETTFVADTPVLMGTGIRPDTVADLLWERNGVFFALIVIESPTGVQDGLKTSDVLEIVEALMAAQDAARR